jgi:hypothetical protein
VRSRIGSQQIRGGPSFARFPTSLGRETKTEPIGEQSGMPGSLPQCMVQNTGSQCTDCLRQPDPRPPAIRTNHPERRIAFHVEKIAGYAFESLLSNIPTSRPRRLPTGARRRPPRPFPRPGRPRQTRPPQRSPCGRWHCRAASPQQSPAAPPPPGIRPAGWRGRRAGSACARCGSCRDGCN